MLNFYTHQPSLPLLSVEKEEYRYKRKEPGTPSFQSVQTPRNNLSTDAHQVAVNTNEVTIFPYKGQIYHTLQLQYPGDNLYSCFGKVSDCKIWVFDLITFFSYLVFICTLKEGNLWDYWDDKVRVDPTLNSSSPLQTRNHLCVKSKRKKGILVLLV